MEEDSLCCLGAWICANPHNQHIHKTTQTHTNNGNSIRNEVDRKVASLEAALSEFMVILISLVVWKKFCSCRSKTLHTLFAS